jgi:lipoate-protein ligase A
MNALRLICDEGYGARGNVALTAAMAELHADRKIPDTLRIYRYPQSVLLGRHEDAEEAADLAACRKRNIEIARRVTGGGAIYMDRGVITWDLVISNKLVGSEPRVLSSKVCRAIAERLCLFGIEACFRPDNDIEVNGKKVAGASGYADGSTLIYQGSLMLAPDLQVMASILRVPAVEDRVTTLSALIGRDVEFEEAAQLLAGAISSGLEVQLHERKLSQEEQVLGEGLFAKEFGRNDFVLAPPAPKVAA